MIEKDSKLATSYLVIAATSTLLAISIGLAGCARTVANPVPIVQAGDENRSCKALQLEIQQMQHVAQDKAEDSNKQTVKNVGLGVAGAFLLVPWFFMDFSNAATTEEKAAWARLQRLQTLYVDKQCA